MATAGPQNAAWIVCIDFGTAFSKAAAARSGASEAFDPALVRPLTIGAVAPANNPFLIESAVFVGDADIQFGAEAVRQAGARAGAKRLALRSFKTLLSAPDLDRALDAFVPQSIDPHRLFRQRDLIVLFLAYLTRAIEHAIAADPVLAGAAIKRRYALPAWRGGAAMHPQVTALFAAADQVSARLGDALFAPAGVPVATAAEALRQIENPEPISMGMVFESTAAAAYTLIDDLTPASHLMVVDMGAGTTDFGALAKSGTQLEEVSEARVTFNRAGDMIDRVLLDLFLQKMPNLKSRADQAELWRTLMASIREIKEALFLDGRAAITHRGAAIAITLQDLQRDRDFKTFVGELKQGFDHALQALAARAASDGQKEICVVAVGGGAHAPFIHSMVRAAKARKVRVRSYLVTPEWAHSAAFGGNLAPIFPQLAIAIGGALAPDALLAA